MDLSFFPVRGYARQCDVSPLYRAQYAYCPSDGRASDSRNDPIAVWDNERRLEISDRTGKRGKLKGYCDRVNERIQGMAGDYSEKYVPPWLRGAHGNDTLYHDTLCVAIATLDRYSINTNIQKGNLFRGSSEIVSSYLQCCETSADSCIFNSTKTKRSRKIHPLARLKRNLNTL